MPTIPIFAPQKRTLLSYLNQNIRFNYWPKVQKFCPGGGIGRHAGLKILWPEMAVRVQVPPRVPWLLRNIVCSLSLCVAAQTNCTFVASIILKIFKLPLLAQFSFHPTVVRFVNGCMKSQDTSCTVRMIFSQKILSPHSQLNKCLNPQNVLPFFLSLPLPEKLRCDRPILCTCSQPEVYKLTSKLQSNFFIRHRTVKDYNLARFDHFILFRFTYKSTHWFVAGAYYF